MDIQKEIRNVIRDEIKKMFESFDFEVASAEQLAKTSSIYSLPRKGINDTINNYNLVSIEQDKKKSEQEKEEEQKQMFKILPANAAIAPTLTNLYEDASVNATSQPQQDNLDFDSGNRPIKASLGKDTEKAVSDFNNNIEMSLKKIKYPGKTDAKYPPVNSDNLPVA